jgi:phosphate butyryltransferase
MKDKIAHNIRRLREERNVSREKLAYAINRDLEFIEKVEEGETEPPVSDMLRIAGCLGTDISSLIYGTEFCCEKVIVTKPEDRTTVDRRHQHSYRSLAFEYSGRHMEPFVLEVYHRKTDELEYNQHPGEEFHFVIKGSLKIIVGEQEYILDAEDSIYFDSALPHALSAVGGSCKILSAIYNSESMLHIIRSRHMRELVQAAQHTGGKNISVICPDKTVMGAVNKGIEEGVIKTAYLIGDKKNLDDELLPFKDQYEFIDIPETGENYFADAAAAGVRLITDKSCQMLMKGKINTAIFLKAVLNKETGIATGRRLSLVSIFELPDLDRLIFLTDPGINPELVPTNDLNASIDIIENAIDVAKGLGVIRPKVALLEANEIPSEKLPSTMHEKKLTEMKWKDALVYGPLSYDLALYPDSVKKKGLKGNPVAGHADILVVPHISGGNFLYKAWALTLKSDVASIVAGAEVPVILTSRGDSETTKFLTLCASSVYS